MSQKFRSQAPRRDRALGAWADYARDKIYGPAGKKYSDFDVMLRREYKRALDGNIKSIKEMLSILEANVDARDYHYPPDPGGVIWYENGPARRVADEPRNADMALMVLGIGAVSNARLKALRANCERPYEEKLRNLRPDVLEAWVYSFARGEPLPSAPACADTGDDSPLREWRASKGQLLADLMRERGPGATRFKPGRSGNSKGRPPARAMYPYEEFFMEEYTVKMGDKTIKTTRLDALMKYLVTKAAKGDDKLQDLLLPILARIKQAEWEEANIIAPPRIIRDLAPRKRKR